MDGEGPEDGVPPYMNPYVVGPAVTGEGRFFGRVAELEKLRTKLIRSSTPLHVSITGETRSGKTSLLMEFLARERATLNARYLVSALDLSADFDRGTTDDFYRQIGDFASDSVVEAGGDVGKDVATSWNRSIAEPDRRGIKYHLSILLTEAATKLRPVLFVLDEFDVAPELVGGNPDAFQILRKLGLHSKVTFLLASRREIGTIEKDAGIRSNFAGIFDLDPIRLAAIEPVAARQLCQEPVRRLGMQWEEAVVERLLLLSGRHPYFLQGLCHRLLQEGWRGPATTQLRLLDRIALQTFRPLFDLQVRRLARTALLDPLCAIMRHGHEHVDRAHSDRLEELGYVFRDGSGEFQPFTPLLYEALEIGGRSTAAVVRDAEPGEELLASWGLSIGGQNLLVEGETDRELLTIAGRVHVAENHENLLTGLTIVPAGLGRSGGARAVARRLVVVVEAARGRGTRVIALLDNDVIGRRIAEALDGLGAQKGKNYLLLERADFPIENFKGVVDVEIEDLLSRRLLDGFAKARPEAVEERLDRGANGVRYGWHGEHKGELVEFVRQHAGARDVERMVRLLRRIRQCLGV